MRDDLAISAFRTMVLNYRAAHHGSTRLPAAEAIVGAEVAPSYPCLQIRPAGGDGPMNPGMKGFDLEITAWGQTGWAILYTILAEVSRACHLKKGADVTPPILYSEEVTSPTQAGVGALQGLRTTYRVIARETP